MSNRTLEQEVDISEVFDTEITDEDYGFVVGPDGELKSIFIPEHLPFKTNKKLQKLFKIFGITDPAQLDSTLHYVSAR
jgi:hypothetical protein